MWKETASTAIAIVLSGLPAPPPSSDEEEAAPKTAPFTAVRFDGDRVRVRIDGNWWICRSIDGVAVEDILEHARSRHGDRYRKRFSEDLPQLFVEMGRPLGLRVDVDVEDPETGERRVLYDVRMTAENRRAVWESNRGLERGEIRRVTRSHPAPRNRSLYWLARRVTGEAPQMNGRQAADDLDQLEWHLKNQHAYFGLTSANIEEALDAIRHADRDGVSVRDFAIQVGKALALLCDGHTRVTGRTAALPGRYLPALPCSAGERVVLVTPDRAGFLDDDRPFLVAIDGLDLDAWLDAARRIVARGSPAFVREHSVRGLRYIDYLRMELGRPAKDDVALTVADARGRARKTLRLETASDKPVFGAWPLRPSAVLDGNVGYLRISRMDGDPEFLSRVERDLRTLRETRGLIVDVRGNGGGTRDVLRLLLPYLMDDDDPPMVCNFAALRLRPGENAGDTPLADRFLYPPDWPGFDAEERLEIARHRKEIRPEWPLPAERFSPLQYMVVGPGKPPFRFRGRVAVLVDSACFSATDIFLGAISELERVALFGAQSGGGSGRARPVVLAHSGLEVRISTMASFRPDGRLYDTRGVEVDEAIPPLPTDFTGETDAVLDAALAWVLGRK